MKSWLVLLVVANLVVGNWIVAGLLAVWTCILAVTEPETDELDEELESSKTTL